MVGIQQRINGEHLKKARLFRGLSLSDLSEKTGITKQTLSLYENEAIRPDFSKLIEVSKALSIPVEYFTAPNNKEIKTEAIYFRSLLSTSKIARTQQSLKLEFIGAIYNTIVEYVDFPEKNLPNISFEGKKDDSDEEVLREINEIEAIATQCRKLWGLGNQPINNLQEILEANGIIVTALETKDKEIDAFSQQISSDGISMFIVVCNTSKNYVRTRFDLAHELGHILLHPWSENIEELSRQEFKERESQANMFAGAFLLPADSFGRDVRVYPTSLEYYVRLKHKWNVSIQAMIYRAHQLGIITISQYQYLMRQVSKKGWRTNEPDDKPYQVGKTLLQESLEVLFANNVLTPSSFIKVLRDNGVILNHEDIEDLLFIERDSLKEEICRPILIKLK